MTACLPAYVTRCRSVVLGNGDTASISGFVTFSTSGALQKLGRVEEIIANPESGAVVGVLVSESHIGSTKVLPYRMPSCRVLPGKRVFLGLQVS